MSTIRILNITPSHPQLLQLAMMVTNGYESRTRSSDMYRILSPAEAMQAFCLFCPLKLMEGVTFIGSTTSCETAVSKKCDI